MVHKENINQKILAPDLIGSVLQAHVSTCHQHSIFFWLCSDSSQSFKYKKTRQIQSNDKSVSRCLFRASAKTNAENTKASLKCIFLVRLIQTQHKLSKTKIKRHEILAKRGSEDSKSLRNEGWKTVNPCEPRVRRQ